MKLEAGDVPWMAAGAGLLCAVGLVVWRFRANDGATEQLAAKARKIDLVDGMSSDLASASETAKSAVMAVIDRDSQLFADQAGAATAEVERKRKELQALLESGGGRRELVLLQGFSEAFDEFQRLDRELLALAVKHTNLKATALAFGPGAGAVEEMTAALARVVAKSASSPDAGSVTLLAFGAETAALHLQTLLAPHIAEESDAKMDELEARMDRDDQEVRRDLDGLAAHGELAGDVDVRAAVTAYARFSEIRADILALSRENSDVRSLALSLNQKRRVMLLCQDSLDALKQALFAEEIPGASYGPPSNPRRLGGESRVGR